MNKLLYVTTVFDPGAIPNIILDMVPQLNSAGWTVEILTLQPFPKDPKALNRAGELGCKVHSLGLPVWKIPQVLWGLSRKIREIKPDLIHTHLGRADIFTAWARPKNIPQISTFHSVRRNFSRSTLWGFKATDSLVSHRTGVSQAAIDSMYGDGYLNSPHSVIYNPVNLNRLEPTKTREEVRISWGVQKSTWVLLNIGRFVEAKGQINLIRALPQILKTYPNVKLVMAGSGPLEKILKSEANKLDVEGSIIWTGFSGSVPDLLQGCDVLVFPSLWEGMGLVPLEALLCKRPVLVSDLPAVREFVPPGPGAVYFPVGEPLEIKIALDALFSTDQRAVQQDLDGRYPELVSRFSPLTIATQYINLYNQVIKRIL